MNKISAIVSLLMLMTSLPAFALEGKHRNIRDSETCCATSNGECNLQNRGRCGKRKGDCYGVRNPVCSIDEARSRLLEYFADRKLTLSEVTEKKWRFEAELLDSSGKVVDRVMIDKRSGRVRSRL